MHEKGQFDVRNRKSKPPGLDFGATWEISPSSRGEGLFDVGEGRDRALVGLGPDVCERGGSV